MKTYNYKIEALNYILPYFRQNEDIVEILRAIGARFEGLQTAILHFLNSQNLKDARGVWLDRYGAEVGATRDEMDYANYFCVNRPHVNVAKRFYFTSTKENPLTPLSLEDAEFIQKILAYIFGNQGCGTWNEIIDITKTITNADKVIVTKPQKCVLNINIIGTNIVLTRNTVTYIQNIVADGVDVEEITINGQTD